MNLESKTKSLLFGMDFIHGIRRAITSALALIYFISLGFNLVAVTTLFAISTIIMMLFEFPTSAIADYNSRKKSILISFFLLFIAFLGIFLFNDFWILASFWIMRDIAWTFCSGANYAWAIDTLNYAKEKSKILSLISKTYIFEKTGRVLGGLIGLLVIAINFKFIWLVISLSYFFIFFTFWIYAEEKNFKKTKSPHNYLVKSIIRAKESFSFLIHKNNNNLQVLMIGRIVSIFSISSFLTIVPLRFAQSFSLSPEYISGIYSIIGVLAILGPFLASKLVVSNFRISLFISVFLMSASVFLFALSSSLILALVCLAILEISLAANDVLQDSACHNDFSSKLRASLSSISSITWAIANSSAVFLTGVLVVYFGMNTALFISGIITLIASLIFLFGMRNTI